MAGVKVKLPSDVTLADNGRIRKELLAACGVFSHFNPSRELNMHHLHAARSMRAMVTEASVTLELGDVRGIDTYRTLQTQTSAFDGTNPANRTEHTGRYVPKPLWGAFAPVQLVNGDVRRWKDQDWKRRVGTVESAVPGQSNHGWGLAVDFAGDQVGRLFPWLQQNAHRFGFVNDNPSEKWHWSYLLGDEPPRAFADDKDKVDDKDNVDVGDVDDDEVETTEGEDDMKVIDLAPNTPNFTRFVISGRVRWVRGHAASVLERLKLAPLEVQRDELKDLMRSFGTDGTSPFNGTSRDGGADAELDAVWEQSRL